MNDPVWVAGLDRARATQKYQFEAIHVIAPLRNEDGVAPVVLQTSTEYLRSPPYMEAAFELCLRHLHKVDAPRPKDRNLTAQALLADRAKAALKLPGRYIPTAEGAVIDTAPQSSYEDEAQPESLVLTPMSCVVESPPLGLKSRAAKYGEAVEPLPPPKALATPAAEPQLPPEALAMPAAEPQLSPEALAMPAAEPQLPPEALAMPSVEPPLLPGRAAKHEATPSLSKKARRRAALKKVRKQRKVLRVAAR